MPKKPKRRNPTSSRCSAPSRPIASSSTCTSGNGSPSMTPSTSTVGTPAATIARASFWSETRAMMPSPFQRRSQRGTDCSSERGSCAIDHGPFSRTKRATPRRISRPGASDVSTIRATRGQAGTEDTARTGERRTDRQYMARRAGRISPKKIRIPPWLARRNGPKSLHPIPGPISPCGVTAGAEHCPSHACNLRDERSSRRIAWRAAGRHVWRL